MRVMFEHMITLLIISVMFFSLSGILLTQAELMTARRIHTSAIDQIQSSFYQIDIDAMNEKLANAGLNGWHLSAEQISEINSRKDWLVRLNYRVVVPIFGCVKEGVIEGFAR